MRTLLLGAADCATDMGSDVRSTTYSGSRREARNKQEQQHVNRLGRARADAQFQ